MREKLFRSVFAMQLAVSVLAAGCGVDRADRAADGVRVGAEVLLSDSLSLVRGRRVGLITNHTGLLPSQEGEARSVIEALLEREIELAALFGPEHGIRGRAEAGERVEHGIDVATGLPIHSLYGATRAPTPEMLEGIDVLLFDIQDIGTRYYTYVWTMAHAMEAAARDGIDFVVLDRPNPIGGRLVQGNVLEPEQRSFVGLYPVPMRHGMTAGELARLVNEVYAVGAQLTVVPMQGWSRDTWYDATGLPWTAPSPNMPSLESATHYPGTCLFEGTNLSVGRGTARAFQQVGAPWLDHEAIARALNDGAIPGLRVDAVTFTPVDPGDGKYDGEAVNGLRFTVTDRSVYDPTVAAVAALVEVQARHADFLAWRDAHFDRLAGTEALRQAILAGADVATATAGWAAQAAAFDALRQPFLLYP